MTYPLRDGEKITDLERNGLLIIQDEKRFCFGMDAVLLTGFARVKDGASVLDIGTGTGILPILLSAKTKAEHFTALEVQEESADMARRSVSMNHLEERIDVVTGDIKDWEKLFAKSSYDTIVTNPPYMIAEHGIRGEADAKSIARHEVLCTLKDITQAAGKLLKSGGNLCMVHRPFRLPEIFAAMQEASLEPKRLRMVYPRADKEPAMVLIEAVRGGKPRLTVEKPLIIYGPDGGYTEELIRDYGF